MEYTFIFKCPHCGKEHEEKVEINSEFLHTTAPADFSDTDLRRAVAAEKSAIKRATDKGETPNTERLAALNAELDKRGMNRRSLVDELRQRDPRTLTDEELDRVAAADTAAKSNIRRTYEKGAELTAADTAAIENINVRLALFKNEQNARKMADELAAKKNTDRDTARDLLESIGLI